MMEMGIFTAKWLMSVGSGGNSNQTNKQANSCQKPTPQPKRGNFVNDCYWQHCIVCVPFYDSVVGYTVYRTPTIKFGLVSRFVDWNGTPRNLLNAKHPCTGRTCQPYVSTHDISPNDKCCHLHDYLDHFFEMRGPCIVSACMRWPRLQAKYLS